ncbi:major facilitator superfamily domain-containing protein 6 [Nematostella vectensis]|uniref:major facilitator superfamily domain-containing protein 6 n=1 Tax=Nematostella vectensis TaxID=45351 RepID=UPI00207725E4|nr:major facilitator superfamily domain-containing protein 6 [Nematostella vectensis]
MKRGGRWRVTKKQLQRCLPNAYYYLFYAALGSLLPFLTLYYRSLGLSAWQIGVLGGIRPLIALLSGPLWCFISNQYNVRKLILVASLISWVAFTLPLGFVSHAQNANCHVGLKSYRNRTTQLVNNTADNVKRGVDHLGMEREFIRETSMEMEAKNANDDNSHGKYLEMKKRDRRGSKVEEKDPRHIELEKPFVNSFSTFGMKLNNGDYRKKRRPYDFKSRGYPYINKRKNPFVKTIFIELFFLVLLGELFQAPTDDMNSHYEGTFLEHLDVLYQSVPTNSLCSALGIALSAFFTGLVITFSPKFNICGEEYSDYKIAFYFFGVLMTMALVVSVKFRLNYRRKRTEFDVLGSLRLLWSAEHAQFVVVTLVMGTFRGLLSNFLYWNTAEIGGSELVVGVTVVSQYLSDILVNMAAPALMIYAGFVGMIYCGLASYAVRFLVYSWLSTPQSAWAIPSVELMHGVSNSLAWSAFILYIINYTPRSTYPVGIFIVQGLYLGVGSGIGGLLGGGMIQLVDTNVSFRVFALVSLLLCLVFVMMQPTGMDEVLPSEVEGLSHFADEDDYSSFSEEELLNSYDDRTLIYTPPHGANEDGRVQAKRSPFTPGNAPFVPMFMSIVKTQADIKPRH